MALPIYAFTLFVSAFILFLVQPIIGKIILPKLGGTPQVWNTCMVFFQMVLLLGYAYTHNVSTRLTLRQQLMAHAVLLLLPLIVLVPFPFSFGAVPVDPATADPQDSARAIFGLLESPTSIWGFVPDLGTNPIPSTLKILFLYVALPFLVVSTSAPLLQKWFVHTGHPAAKDPYFLYGASNFGSMLSLILYPVLIEPLVSLRAQGWMYTFGYLALIACFVVCASLVWTSKEPHPAKPKVGPEPKPAAPTAPPQTTTGEPQTAIAPGAAPSKPAQPAKPGAKPSAEPSVALPTEEVSAGRRLRWVLLAAIPSSLMLGITTHITTDLSPIPLFWLVPLILYLLSFILVFARWPVVWVEQPHNYMVIAQPFCLAFMIMVDVLNWTGSTTFLGFAIFAHVAGFFTTTMVCHGELAKDRPSTKHLTEFYLMMSVGGMLGGMFNALIAPVVFKKLWELPLAIFAAGMARPQMAEAGFGDNWLAGTLEGQPDKQAPAKAHKGHKPPQHAPTVAVGANESLVRTLDWVWPIGILIITGVLIFFLPVLSRTFTARPETSTVLMFGIPLALCCAAMARPWRIGLGIGAVLLMWQFVYLSQFEAAPIYSDRSYFGTISVKQTSFRHKYSDQLEVTLTYNQLVHGHILHGQNFEVPPGPTKENPTSDRGNPKKDWSRLATTYYHREGPAGRVMEKFNWFPGEANTFHADARMPASLIASLAGDMLMSSLPLGEFVTLWSEPPYATVGLGTGTMASYARPYQHAHFYEIDNQILRLSLLRPTREINKAGEKKVGNKVVMTTPFEGYAADVASSPDKTYFNYLERALERGGVVQVMMGDARLRMALPYKNHYQDLDKKDDGGGPNNFYHMMVVDAFSSDAIPAHLLTKQAFEMYFTKLTEKGVLCVHTSNRFVDLPLVVAAVADELGYSHARGHDINEERANGHTTSEWVMVARNSKYLDHLVSGDTAFRARYRKALEQRPEYKEGRRDIPEYWDLVSVKRKYLWTDDYYNLMSVVKFR